MIGAIVLAAGRSRRMGTQKLLLPFAGQTVIGHVVDQLLAASIDKIFVVVSGDAPAINQALAGRPVELVENPDPESEMLCSVRCGLRALPSDCEAALIAVGDQPAITTSLVRKVVDAYQSSGRGIVVPVAGEKRGHPTILAARYFSEILQSFDGVGLRGLLLAHPDDMHEVETDDPALLADIDLPVDYLRAVQASAGDPKCSRCR
jgi:molybdenum cofactor cytidylyltransferase